MTDNPAKGLMEHSSARKTLPATMLVSKKPHVTRGSGLYVIGKAEPHSPPALPSMGYQPTLYAAE